MKFIKDNIRTIIAFIIGVILAGGIVYAATSAKEVTYTTNKNASIKNVEEALNDLYSNNSKTPLTLKKSQDSSIEWNSKQSDSISLSHEVTKECNYICIAIISNDYYVSNPTCSVSGTQISPFDLGKDTIKIGYGVAKEGDNLTVSAAGTTTNSYCNLHCYIFTDE